MRRELLPREGYMDDPFSYTIRKRLSRDENTMIRAIGPPRRGKSYSLLTLGGMIDINNDFGADHVVFTPQDYIDKIRKSKKGCFIVLDEAGSEWGARRFMSVENILMSATHITFGSKLINVGWAVPSVKMQDINASRLVNYSFTMLKAPFHKGTARFYTCSANESTGKVYSYYVGIIAFAKPFQDDPDELKKYEKLKAEYQDRRYEEYWEKFEEDNKGSVEKGKLGNKELLDIATKIVDDPTPYTLSMKGKDVIKPELVMNEENISVTDARKAIIIATKLIQDRGN